MYSQLGERNVGQGEKKQNLKEANSVRCGTMALHSGCLLGLARILHPMRKCHLAGVHNQTRRSREATSQIFPS
jgi:hypothetical protein